MCCRVTVMDINEADPLAQYVGLKTGRNVTREEVASALGLSRHTYKNRRARGSISASDIIAVARHYDLNEVDALIELGYLNADAVLAYTQERMGGGTPDFPVAPSPKAVTRPQTIRTRTKKAGINDYHL